MIVNKPQAKLLPPLAALEACEFELYLGGSRRMSQLEVDASDKLIIISKDTDYDYYATYSTELEIWLLSAGFVEKEHIHYCDDQYVKLLEAFDNTLQTNIQVVLKHDAEFYQAIFENIGVKYYHAELWKSNKKFNKTNEDIVYIFNMFYKQSKAVLQLEVARNGKCYEKLKGLVEEQQQKPPGEQSALTWFEPSQPVLQKPAFSALDNIPKQASFENVTYI